MSNVDILGLLLLLWALFLEV